MKIIILTLLVSFVCINLISSEQAYATSTLLPIKSRIVSCITQEERMQMCQDENLCCHLLTAESRAKNPVSYRNHSLPLDEEVMSDIDALRQTAGRLSKAFGLSVHLLQIGVNMMLVVE